MKKIVNTFTKIFVRDGKRHRIVAVASLGDECRNNICTFSITGQIDIFCFGSWHCKTCGCITDEIYKFFPELKPFVNLHMCNYKGQPFYTVDNGIYYVSQSKEIAMRNLRITEDEYGALLPAAELNDKDYFVYKLFQLGIVKRWKSEADKFIEFLLRQGGEWENPYTISDERPTIKLTGGIRALVESRLKKGYYTKENIDKILQQRRAEEISKKRQSIIEEYYKKTEKARNERDVMLYILDHGLSIGNVIYYDYNNTVKFNWLDYKEQITKEQFDNFIGNLDPSKLPEGIKFSIDIKK